MLVDPGKQEASVVAQKVQVAQENGVDLILLGGSRVPPGSTRETVEAIASVRSIPLVLFPGADSPQETLVKSADAFLCPLVHNRVTKLDVHGWYREAAERARHLKLLAVPMSYIYVHEGPTTSAEAEAGIVPFSYDDGEAVGMCASVGEMRGQCLTYLEGGSGSKQPVPNDMVRLVWERTENPIIVGGGITSPEIAGQKVRSGASLIVVGTRLEQGLDSILVRRFAEAVHEADIA